MDKPIILTVDDDPAVLQSISRDLRQQYGDRFRIVRADSGDAALEVTEQLKLRGDTVALFLVDQRMPGMSGVEFLEQGSEIFRRRSDRSSPPMPTRTRLFLPLMTLALTITCSSLGTHRKRSFIRF